MRRLPSWAELVVIVILVALAFAVPLVGPLRQSSARLPIAGAILIVGAIVVALLVLGPSDDT